MFYVFWEWVLEYSRIPVFLEHFELCWGGWKGTLSMFCSSQQYLFFQRWLLDLLIIGGGKFLISAVEVTVFMPLWSVDMCNMQVHKKKQREQKKNRFFEYVGAERYLGKTRSTCWRVKGQMERSVFRHSVKGSSRTARVNVYAIRTHNFPEWEKL